MRCIFCPKEIDEKADPPEHIIPEAMGNKTLTCNFVCKCCNHKLSPIEDRLIRAPHIVLARHILGVKDKNGEVPSIDFGNSTVEGEPGVKVHYVVQSDGAKELRIGGKRENGSLSYSEERFTEEEVRKVLERYKKKEMHTPPFEIWAREGHGWREKFEEMIQTLKKQGIEGRIISEKKISPWFNKTLVIDFGGWLRTYAKIALEYYILLFPDYSNSSNVDVFGQFIFDEGLKNIESSPIAIAPLRSEGKGAPVSFNNEEHGLLALGGIVFIVLFGQPTVAIDMHPVEDSLPDYITSLGKDGFVTVINVNSPPHETLKYSEFLRKRWKEININE